MNLSNQPSKQSINQPRQVKTLSQRIEQYAPHSSAAEKRQCNVNLNLVIITAPQKDASERPAELHRRLRLRLLGQFRC